MGNSLRQCFLKIDAAVGGKRRPPLPLTLAPLLPEHAVLPAFFVMSERASQCPTYTFSQTSRGSVRHCDCDHLETCGRSGKESVSAGSCIQS